MKNAFKYTFYQVEKCIMCQSPSSNAKTLGMRMKGKQGKAPWKNTSITTSVKQCKNCGLIYADPLPVPEHINDHYGVPPENYWVEDYFKIDPDFFKSQSERAITILNSTFGKGPYKSLDIGAGIGKQMIAMKKAGFEAYGLEPSEPFYERAISKMGVDPERLILSTAEEAQYPDNFFHFISFRVVLEHLYDPDKNLQNAIKWLKPGGLIYVEVPSSKWLINQLARIYYRLRGSNYVSNISPMHTPFHLYEFSPKSFQLNGKKNNYRVIDSYYLVCDTFMPKVFDTVLVPFMKYTKTGMQLYVWLQKE